MAKFFVGVWTTLLVFAYIAGLVSVSYPAIITTTFLLIATGMSIAESNYFKGDD